MNKAHFASGFFHRIVVVFAFFSFAAIAAESGIQCQCWVNFADEAHYPYSNASCTEKALFLAGGSVGECAGLSGSTGRVSSNASIYVSIDGECTLVQSDPMPFTFEVVSCEPLGSEE